MVENTAQTVWVRAYTPAGSQVGITFGFRDGKPIPASELDSIIAEQGYLISLPGMQVGEEVETMTHIVRMNQVNKKNGSITPKLYFYHKTDVLEHKFDHVYMNDAEQIEQLEKLSGLDIEKLPVWKGATLKTTDPEASQFLIQMPNPVRVAWKFEEVEAFGKMVETKKIQRFIGASQASTPDNVTDMPKQDNKSTSAGWLSNQSALDKVKEKLTFFELDYGDDAVTKARETIKAGGYNTPDLFLEALETQIKSIGA